MRTPRQEYQNVPRHVALVTSDFALVNDAYRRLESAGSHPRTCTRYIRIDGHRVEVYCILADVSATGDI